MNRYLLAGCAAVALAMGSGAANAQAKFEVKVGGDVFFEWGYVDQDNDTGLRSTEMRNRFRFNLIPSAKADNGLEYGARIRVRADSNNASGRTLTQDRAYIFAQGGFGQVRLGTTNGFNDETVVSRPIDYLPFGLFVQGPEWFGSGGTDLGARQLGILQELPSTGYSLWPSFAAGAATRVVYFSPRFAGFQLGASYTPRNDDSTNSIQRSNGPLTALTATSPMATSYQDLLEVGANYDQSFGGVRVKAGAGYYWGEASDVTGARFKNMNALQLGAQVGFAGVTVGGSYTDFGKSGLNKNPAVTPFRDNAKVWQAGAQYTVGPIVVGGGWMYGQDSGSAATPGKREINTYEVGASYTVAPGLAVQAQYNYVDVDSDIAALSDKGSVVVLRTTLAF